MAPKKESNKTSKFDRGLDAKLRDQEENSVQVVTPKPISSGSTTDEAPSRMKVEMTHLVISDESKAKVLDTLKFISGEDFEAKSKFSYKDKKTNLSNQYWVDRGALIIHSTTDYSSMQRRATLPQERVNAFALAELKTYGFHESHCSEALHLKQGEVGKAWELLMSHYMGLTLPDPDTQVSEVILEERAEELETIKGIYGDMCKEQIANQLWIIHMELPYLANNFTNRTGCESGEQIQVNSKINTKLKKLCQFYLKGNCRFGMQCKYSHEVPVSKPVVVKCPVEEEREKNRTKFDLVIRFPQGCLYPKEAPQVAVKPLGEDMPYTARLRLTHHLQGVCQSSAQDQFPCVYTLINELQEDNQENILAVVNKKGPADCILDPAQPLYDKSKINELETVESDEESEEQELKRKKDDRSKPLERIKMEDDELVKRFLSKQNNQEYRERYASRKGLPAFNKIEEILKSVYGSQVVVVSGETGCGKSTQVPQYLLDDWLSQRSRREVDNHVEIICTQPRRLSAIGVAERVAYERCETVGASVGYQIRLEAKMSSKTRLTFCTTGILLRRLEGDPLLSSVSHIIVDEVHERSEESDFLLLILKKLLPLRPDIRVILMSATLNASLFCQYFNNVPIIDIPGRTFPVEQLFLEDILEMSYYALEENSRYSRKLGKSAMNVLDNLETELELMDIKTGNMIANPKTADQSLNIKQLFYRYDGFSKQTCKGIYLMDQEKINYDLIEHLLMWIVSGDHDYPQEGSILVFLPGMQEIRELHDSLSRNETFKSNYILVPLHSSLSSDEQAQVFRKPRPGVRKIVLSTNIAETSVTIDDCVFVIDSGRMKEKRFDTSKNMESLETVWVSRANALQRKGRAGRVRPGVCIHLYTHHHFRYHLAAQPVPEIQRVPLEQTLLRIKMLPSLSESTLKKVLSDILEPPSAESIEGAITRLTHVGALDSSEDLTPLGRHLASLPVDVRIGKLLLYGAMFNCLDSVLTIAASLSQKSPFTTSFKDNKDEVDKKKKEFSIANSDHFTILRAYNSWRKAATQSRRGGEVYARENFMSYRTLVTLVGIKAQFLDYLVDIGFSPENCRVRNKRSPEDTILDVTGPELNANGDNYKLLAGLLSAALYPNIVKVLTPEKYYAQSVAGAVPKELRSDELKFKTKSDGYVSLHRSSVNFNVSHFMSPYLVFQEKVKTSRVFIRDCTMVPVLPLVMFSSNEITIERTSNTFTLSLEQGWIVFIVPDNKIGELLQCMQKELLKLMEQKIKTPSLNLNADSKGKRIISTITFLVTHG